MTTRDVERIRFVTRHFNELQGLRFLVPWGLMLLSQALMDYLGRDRPLLVPLSMIPMVGVVVWMLRAGAYYRRTFGEVEQRPAGLGVGGSSLPAYGSAGWAPVASGRRPLDLKLRWLILAASAAYALLLLLKAILPSAALMTDRSKVGPWWLDPLLAQTMCYAFGMMFLVMWFLKKERHLYQMYYLAIGLLLLGLALLGTFLGLIIPELRNLKTGSLIELLLPFLADPWWAQILCGTSMILAGLLDHLQLARALKPMREVEA